MKNKKLFLASVLCVSAILAACNMQPNEKASSKVKSSKTTSSREVKKSKLTYNLNYEGAPEATSVEIEEGEIVKPIADPTREGRAFMGWCVDAAGSDFYVFGHELEEDTVIYAKWADAGLKKFVAEAEYCPCITEADDGKGMVGSTYSGGTQGKGLIQKETADMWADASNGHWVHFLYQPGADLIFEIKAEAACKALTSSSRSRLKLLATRTSTCAYPANISLQNSPFLAQTTRLSSTVLKSITPQSPSPMFQNRVFGSHSRIMSSPSTSR